MEPRLSPTNKTRQRTPQDSDLRHRDFPFAHQKEKYLPLFEGPLYQNSSDRYCLDHPVLCVTCGGHSFSIDDHVLALHVGAIVRNTMPPVRKGKAASKTGAASSGSSSGKQHGALAQLPLEVLARIFSHLEMREMERRSQAVHILRAYG